MESERDHLTRLAKGEIASFDVLFVRYYPLVLHFIMGFVKNEEDARDLSQDLFLKLWLHREKMPEVVIEDAPLFAWRGFHLDLARHMFTKAYLKKTIDRLAG
jgi:RNA polymerase sigma-70 factor (ECF subfamily)